MQSGRVHFYIDVPARTWLGTCVIIDNSFLARCLGRDPGTPPALPLGVALELLQAILKLGIALRGQIFTIGTHLNWRETVGVKMNALRIRSVRRLIGKSVVNADGQTLGCISDMVIEMDHGMVAYLCLDVQGHSRLSERVATIPFGDIRFDADADHFVLNVAPATLRSGAAPLNLAGDGHGRH